MAASLIFYFVKRLVNLTIRPNFLTCIDNTCPIVPKVEGSLCSTINEPSTQLTPARSLPLNEVIPDGFLAVSQACVLPVRKGLKQNSEIFQHLF